MEQETRQTWLTETDVHNEDPVNEGKHDDTDDDDPTLLSHRTLWNKQANKQTSELLELHKVAAPLLLLESYSIYHPWTKRCDQKAKSVDGSTGLAPGSDPLGSICRFIGKSRRNYPTSSGELRCAAETSTAMASNYSKMISITIIINYNNNIIIIMIVIPIIIFNITITIKITIAIIICEEDDDNVDDDEHRKRLW